MLQITFYASFFTRFVIFPCSRWNQYYVHGTITFRRVILLIRSDALPCKSTSKCRPTRRAFFRPIKFDSRGFSWEGPQMRLFMTLLACSDKRLSVTFVFQENVFTEILLRQGCDFEEYRHGNYLYNKTSLLQILHNVPFVICYKERYHRIELLNFYIRNGLLCSICQQKKCARQVTIKFMTQLTSYILHIKSFNCNCNSMESLNLQ